MTEPNFDRQLEKLRHVVPPAQWEAGMADSLAKGLEAVHPLPHPAVRASITFAMLMLVVVAIGFGAGGKGWRILTAFQTMTLLPLTAIALWLSAELGWRMAPGSRIYLPAVLPALGALVAAVLWPFAATPLQPMKLFYPVCIAITSVAAVALALLLAVWLRRGLFTAPGAGWLLAATAGLAGFGAVEIFCPVVEAGHIATSHVVPGVIAGAAAGLRLWRWLTRRH